MVEPPEERRVKLTLHYDGGAFHGWQIQPRMGTVQAELEAALSRLTARPTQVIGAGRTDAGVHATGQVASTRVPAKWTAGELRRALNAVLPEQIWVAAAEEVPAAFHARYSAIARGYVYRLGTIEAARSPFQRRWCWPLAEVPDAERLSRAAALLVGEHAFGAFAKAGQEERGERCVVHGAHWRSWGLGMEFHIVANRFLHHMVRYLVGTMVDVALGNRPFEDMAALLAGRGALITSGPAPAKGLFLTRVYYTPEELVKLELMSDDVVLF